MLHLVMLLLASGCVTLSARINREYILISERKIWREAQSYCRTNHADLATIESLDDMKVMSKIGAARGTQILSWIGLSRNGVESWMWSSGEPHGLAEYTNWASFTDSSHRCGAMRTDGKWISASCGTQKPFVCQADDSSSLVSVVHTNMSWRRAQDFCRERSRHLASVRNQSENEAVQEMLNGYETSAPTFWIGLFRDDWKWSDQSNSSFRHWYSTQPNNDGRCVLYQPYGNTLWDRSCTSPNAFFCHNVITTRWIMRVEMRSNYSLNFSDSTVSDAILNQIHTNHKAVKFHWRVQPDGKIFHSMKQINKKYLKTCPPCYNNDPV